MLLYFRFKNQNKFYTVIFVIVLEGGVSNVLFSLIADRAGRFGRSAKLNPLSGSSLTLLSIKLPGIFFSVAFALKQ